jgi:hypothetical protein
MSLKITVDPQPEKRGFRVEEVQDQHLEFLISCLETLKVLPGFKEVFCTIFCYLLDSFILL